MDIYNNPDPEHFEILRPGDEAFVVEISYLVCKRCGCLVASRFIPTHVRLCK